MVFLPQLGAQGFVKPWQIGQAAQQAALFCIQVGQQFTFQVVIQHRSCARCRIDQQACARAPTRSLLPDRLAARIAGCRGEPAHQIVGLLTGKGQLPAIEFQ
ncbi:hypothetical protein D3C76_685270 [compost metagenome]